MKPSERSLEGVMAELKALRQAYGAAQRRCTATVQRLHARNQLLEAEVLQLRAQLAVWEPSMAMAGDEQRRMLASAQATQAGRATLSARIESLAQRLQTLLRGASATLPAGAWPAAAQGGVSETGTSTRPSGQPLHPADDDRAGGPDATDDVEDPPDLEERLVEADLVICQTGCLSHQAYWRGCRIIAVGTTNPVCWWRSLMPCASSAFTSVMMRHRPAFSRPMVAPERQT